MKLFVLESRVHSTVKLDRRDAMMKAILDSSPAITDVGGLGDAAGAEGGSASVAVTADSAHESGTDAANAKELTEEERRKLEWSQSCQKVLEYQSNRNWCSYASVIRLGLEPHEQWMQEHMELYGTAREVKEMAKEAKRQLDPTNEALPKRTYPAIESAKNTLELKFLQRVYLMYDSTLFEDVVPLADSTLSLQHLLFKLCSGSECLAESNLFFVHEGMPLHAVLIIVDATVAHELATMRECLLGPLLDFVRSYKNTDEGLNGAEPQARMLLYVIMHKANIIKLETLHASLRRLIFNHSIQTHGEDFGELSSAWMLFRLRQRKANSVFQRSGAVPAETGNADTTTKDDNAREAVSKEFQNKPNPWNLYVRKQSLGVTGCKPDTSKLNADYHAFWELLLRTVCRIAVKSLNLHEELLVTKVGLSERSHGTSHGRRINNACKRGVRNWH